MGGVNLWLFREINGWPESWAPFLKLFSEAGNQLWFKLFVLALAVGLIAAGKRYRRAAFQALIAFPIANGLTDLWKLMPEPRPFQELHEYTLRAGWSASHGTASAHAANMAAVAFAFTYNLGWWGSPLVPIAVLTGISRVYVGVHYPYQVLLGWGCGLVAGLAVAKVWEAVSKRRNAGALSPNNAPLDGRSAL